MARSHRARCTVNPLSAIAPGLDAQDHRRHRRHRANAAAAVGFRGRSGAKRAPAAHASSCRATVWRRRRSQNPLRRGLRSSVTGASLTRSPPALIWRRASPVDATRPAFTKAREHAEALGDFLAETATLGSDKGERALFECRARGLRGRIRRRAAMQERGRLRREQSSWPR